MSRASGPAACFAAAARLALTTAALAVGGSAASAAQPALRYAIQAGDHLLYERVALLAALDSGAVRQRIGDQIQLWCVEQRGEQRVVLLQLIHAVDGVAEPPRGAVLEIDARGARRLTPAAQTRIAELDAAFDVIPVLRAHVDPADAWLSPPDPYGRQWRCALEGPDPQRDGQLRVSFRVEDATGVSGFLGEERSGSFWFDPSGAIVTRVESEHVHRTAGVALQAKLKLRQRRRVEPGWTVLRADEARRFLTLLDNEDRLLRDVLNRPAQFESTVRHVQRLWSALAPEAGQRDDSPLRALAAAQQRRAAAAEPSLRQAADRSVRWLDRRTPEWTLQTPEGQTLRSATFRGRPTVECFWSAESLWGLRALEMMRRFRRAVDPSAVNVLCLNMDRDAALARRAIEACGAGLTHVLAEPLAANEPPMDFPTVRLLDGAGVVRQIVVGWRPELHDELSAALADIAAGR